MIVGRSELRAGHASSCGCLRERNITSANKSAYGSVLGAYKRNAKKANRKFLLPDEEFRELITSKCYYCGKKPSESTDNYSAGVIAYNGLDRIDNSRGYTLDNVRPCCPMCNFIKNRNSEAEFLSMVKAIYENLNLESI